MNMGTKVKLKKLKGIDRLKKFQNVYFALLVSCFVSFH